MSKTLKLQWKKEGDSMYAKSEHKNWLYSIIPFKNQTYRLGIIRIGSGVNNKDYPSIFKTVSEALEQADKHYKATQDGTIV